MDFDYSIDKKITMNQERLKLDLASVDDLNKSNRLYWAIVTVLFGVTIPLIETTWDKIFFEQDVRFIFLSSLMILSILMLTINFILFGVLKIEFQIDHLPKDIYDDPKYSKKQYLINLESAVKDNDEKLSRKSKYERYLGISLIIALFALSSLYLANKIIT